MVSRGRRQFNADQAVSVPTASNKTIHLRRVLSEEGSVVRFHRHSEERQQKVEAIANPFVEIFETGLARLAVGLKKRLGEKKREKLLQRIDAYRRTTMASGGTIE